MFAKNLAILFAIGVAVATPTAARALDLVALTDSNQLVWFSDGNPRQAQTTAITGATGRIVGIDVRPADNMLYAVGADGAIYRLARTGAATAVSKISEPFDASRGVVVDFNPVADRMRLIAAGGAVSLRINVENGQAVIDKPLAYKAGDANAGKSPVVRAAAYINSIAGAKETQLFDIDSATGGYVIQDPPNDGVLTTIGSAGVTGRGVDAIDIFTDARGDYMGFAVARNEVFKLNVTRGTLTPLGMVGTAKLIDVAALRP